MGISKYLSIERGRKKAMRLNRFVEWNHNGGPFKANVEPSF
jgi:hypothetical protein